MNRGLSLWLDVLRVGATFAVVLSHLAYPRFTRGDYAILRELNIGSDAVIVFFVVSGFVIAYAARRDGTAGRYGFNRLTRLWLVLIPAIILTCVFDRIGIAVDASAYPAGFYQPLGFWEMLLRGTMFGNEWDIWGRVRLGSNGPLWSLSYEAAYYLLFGIAVFLRGPRKWVLLICVALLAGPRILLLMPAWLMGVWLWHRVSRSSAPGPSGWPLALAGPVLYAACLWAGVPAALAGITAEVLEPASYRSVLAFSDEFLWNALIGVFTAMHLLGVSRIAAHSVRDILWVRWMAGASFSIYVTHYPALHLLDAALPETAIARDALLLVGALGIGLVFAQIFERRIGPLRAGLLRLGGLRKTRRPVAAE